MTEISIVTNPADIAACFDIRRTVFVQEQGVPEAEEIDGLDDQCVQILARHNGLPVGTARIKYLPDYAKIQRVCILKEARGTGLGAEIMKFMIEYERQRGELSTIRLDAQIQALDFYRRLGFVEEGEEFLDAGISHLHMRLEFDR
ncbi:MAG: GNAT family N-acetyltransferase [Alphaproteobacteria bacterium]|nr:GNAT family N-acetyltransferase [Alphaproteobacteria bacterium SS10]